MTSIERPGEIAIEVAGAGKRYTKYDDTPLLLTSAARLRRRTRRAKLWAVRGVDLAIPRGTTYGIIGRNGSGKTTLLSMMAGVTAPSEGSVRVWGRIAPLIAVGVGFNRELTGRENVYLNGSILGLTRTQIDERLEAIVDFADIGDFLDTPAKFYSSGMYVRLGFSVAVHCEPQILLVDEVLAVGDLGFQMKCFERMKSLQDQGTTLVVISHNLGALQRTCDQILVLHRGRPVFQGDPTDAIAEFHALLEQESMSDEDAVLDSGLRYQQGMATVESLEVVGADGAPASQVTAGTTLTVRLTTEVHVDLEDYIVNFTVTGPGGQAVYSEWTSAREQGPIAGGQRVAFTMSFPANVPTGSYSMTAVLQSDLRTAIGRTKPWPFFVTGRLRVGGAADLLGTIDRHDLSPAPALIDAASDQVPAG